jgi:hypothetical protein
MKWSNDRFSIMTTTMWSMPDAAGSGRVEVVDVEDVDVAAEAIVGLLEKGSLVRAAVPPTTAAPRNCRRVTFTNLKIGWASWSYQALQRPFIRGSPSAGGSVGGTGRSRS